MAALLQVSCDGLKQVKPHPLTCNYRDLPGCCCSQQTCSRRCLALRCCSSPWPGTNSPQPAPAGGQVWAAPLCPPSAAQGQRPPAPQGSGSSGWSRQHRGPWGSALSDTSSCPHPAGGLKPALPFRPQITRLLPSCCQAGAGDLPAACSSGTGTPCAPPAPCEGAAAAPLQCWDRRDGEVMEGCSRGRAEPRAAGCWRELSRLLCLLLPWPGQELLHPRPPNCPTTPSHGATSVV